MAVTPGGVLSAGHRPGAVLRIDARHLAQAARSASRLLLAGYTGGDIQLWSLAGGELLGDLGVSGEVLSMAFSPDGGRLAVGQDDGAVLIWNLTDDAPPVAGRGHVGAGERSVMTEPTDPVLAVDFGTSGTCATLADGSRTRQLREPASGDWSWPSAVFIDGNLPGSAPSPSPTNASPRPTTATN